MNQPTHSPALSASSHYLLTSFSSTNLHTLPRFLRPLTISFALSRSLAVSISQQNVFFLLIERTHVLKALTKYDYRTSIEGETREQRVSLECVVVS
jgi:hypothetical protein